MTKKLQLACAGLILLSACLENEENIVIRPDGSVQITVSSKGDRSDLLSGSPVPQYAPWQAVDLETAGRSGREERPAEGERQVDKEQLKVRAEFGRIEDAPRFYTPPHDPYRSAGLERSSSLRIEDLGNRKIYIFERRYLLPGPRIKDPMHDLEKVMPKELQATFEAKGEPTRSQWQWLSSTLLRRHQELAATYFREAFLPLFLDSSVQLSSQDLDSSIQICGERLTGFFTMQRLQAIYDELRGEVDQPGKSNPLQALEQDVRAAMRSSIADELAQVGLEEEQRGRCLARLEWLLAASDHGDDLADEKFRVELRMPGKIIAGNFNAQAGGSIARWEFEGGDLRDREIILRVTSIVE